MAYTRPSASAADFTWSGASAYTRPASAAADLSFSTSSEVDGIISVASPLGAVLVLAAGAAARTAAASPLGAALITAAGAAARASAASPLGAILVLGSVPMSAWAAAPSPLGAALVKGYHDFTGQLATDTATHYVMDLTTPGGLVRVPISSWQATLQTGASCYVQCVVPAAVSWVDSINDATEFIVSRVATTADGGTVEYEMARSPISDVSLARGPTNYTATLSGYSDAFAEDEDPSPTFDRTLAGIRSVTTGTTQTRVRCAIDWLLRPGQRAYYEDGSSFVTAFINYYVPTGNDAYMDVGG